MRKFPVGELVLVESSPSRPSLANQLVVRLQVVVANYAATRAALGQAVLGLTKQHKGLYLAKEPACAAPMAGADGPGQRRWMVELEADTLEGLDNAVDAATGTLDLPGVGRATVSVAGCPVVPVLFQGVKGANGAARAEQFASLLRANGVRVLAAAPVVDPHCGPVAGDVVAAVAVEWPSTSPARRAMSVRLAAASGACHAPTARAHSAAHAHPALHHVRA